MLMIALPGPLRAGEGPDSREPAWGLCKQATARAEAARDLPPHLLIAIARTESGRWHAASSETLAWPWTVMAEGKGRFLPSQRSEERRGGKERVSTCSSRLSAVHEKKN